VSITTRVVSSNPRPWRGAHDTALCDKVCPWLILLPNIDRRQQVEDYVRGTCSRNPRPWRGLHDTALCDKVGL
jgi:hypothetical protein